MKSHDPPTIPPERNGDLKQNNTSAELDVTPVWLYVQYALNELLMDFGPCRGRRKV